MSRIPISLLLVAGLASSPLAVTVQRAGHATAKRATTSHERPEISTMVGTWTLRAQDKPQLEVRLIFHSDGTFLFVGPNWRSAGSFWAADKVLSLSWTSVDGSRVQPGTMRKRVPMSQDGDSFRVDSFTYFRLKK